MQFKSNIDVENITRMKEIAEIYSITRQTAKSEKYHKIIIQICDKYPKNEKMLSFKIESLNYLNKRYKSLETTHKLLNLNPFNINALINLAKHLGDE